MGDRHRYHNTCGVLGELVRFYGNQLPWGSAHSLVYLNKCSRSTEYGLGILLVTRDRERNKGPALSELTASVSGVMTRMQKAHQLLPFLPPGKYPQQWKGNAGRYTASQEGGAQQEGRNGGGGLEWEVGVSRCKLLSVEEINSKVLRQPRELYS